MRKSPKQARLTQPDVQLLQPSYSEAFALTASASGDVELGMEYTSVSEQRKQAANPPVRK
ncbi:hypothetical protein ACFFK0_08740 [Paenibacillus chartarius]|uniref:Uncharacterized protein n=1 Tax=Paenibacillus chartarius TaxID=747481 RepID=A0ABV6DIR9_9BACL